MDKHKIFRTAAIPVILMITGLKHCTENLFFSIFVVTGIYLIASFLDNHIKKR